MQEVTYVKHTLHLQFQTLKIALSSSHAVSTINSLLNAPWDQEILEEYQQQMILKMLISKIPMMITEPMVLHVTTWTHCCWFSDITLI